jgi:phenylacetate-CoA ligase
MISDIKDIVWPPILIGEKATIAALVAEMRSTQYMDSIDLEEMQQMQLERVIKHHANNTESFAERLADQGLEADKICSLDGIKRLEPINKAYIQKQGTRFFCEEVPLPHGPAGKVQTSGSTGEPITVMRTAINQLYWEVLSFRDHEWNQRDYSLKLCAIRANIWNNISMPVWGVPVSKLYPTGAAMGMNVGLSVEDQIKKLEEFQPNILVVHAGVMLAMVNIWEKTGFTLKDLRHIKNIGDTVSDELRDRVRNLIGLEIEDNYSSSETGCIAIQCKEGGQYHIMSETLLVEILHADNTVCQPGEIGRVVITDLHNTASPVIRYDLGDYAEVGTNCTCGRTLPTLKRIIGRERNLFIRSDGSRFWPKAGMYDLPDVMPIRQWQIVQHSVDHVEYKLVTDEEPTQDQIDAITTIAHSKLGFTPKITVTTFRDRLPLSKSGKFEESICLIK